MGMELDVSHAVVLERGAGRKLTRPELLVSELDRIPAAGVAPHIHREHADAFYVLEGEVVFEPAGEPVAATAGMFVLAPAGLVHGFRPPEGRFLNFHAPGEPYTRPGGDSYDPPPDGGLPRSEAVLVAAGEGEPLSGDERLLRVKVTRPELDVLEFEVAPGYDGPGPHFHREHVDSFYVLAGELEFRLGDETVRAPAGTFVAAPPGVVHAFTNPGPDGARFLNVHAPDRGFVEYLRARARGEDVDPADYDIHDV
jgi:quercetin dioxygenase-like cupin family protein